MVRHRLKLLLLPLLAALMLAASSPVMPGPSAVHRVQPVDIRLLRPGDLIFRSGRGHRAEMVRLFSQDELTHVGIIDVGATEAFVIHAAPPEGEFPGGVIREPLDHFIAADQASAVRIYHRRVSPARRSSG